MFRFRPFGALVAVAFAAMSSASFSARAHGPVVRVPEVAQAEARLFVADSASGDVVVVDLPNNEPTARITTPPFIMLMGLTPDGRHLFAMRGRDTDFDSATIIRAGFEADTGIARRALVTRTFQGFAPGGISRGVVSTVDGRVAMVNEAKGELLVFGGDINGEGALSRRRIPLAGPDHYHYREVNGRLYVGHLRLGLVQILDPKTGTELGRIEGCPILHGVAQDSENRLLFACSQDTIVVATDDAHAGTVLFRIRYPEAQRVAAFWAAQQDVFWGYTEGTLPLLYRLDMKENEPSYTTVPVKSSVRQGMSADGALLLSLTRGGVLEIRDAMTGILLRSVRVSDPFPADFHEHVGKAILPDIVAHSSSKRPKATGQLRGPAVGAAPRHPSRPVPWSSGACPSLPRESGCLRTPDPYR